LSRKRAGKKEGRVKLKKDRKRRRMTGMILASSLRPREKGKVKNLKTTVEQNLQMSKKQECRN
jgi:hypothetical protein